MLVPYVEQSWFKLIKQGAIFKTFITPNGSHLELTSFIYFNYFHFVRKYKIHIKIAIKKSFYYSQINNFPLLNKKKLY